MSRSLDRAAIALTSSAATGQRYVDMSISLRDWDGKRELIRVGGRWDRQAAAWSGEAKTGMEFRVHPGQYEVADWYCRWLQEYTSGSKTSKRPGDLRWKQVVMMTGGRGGGKTEFGTMGAVMLAVSMPARIVWCVSPTEEETEELQAVIDKLVPQPAWAEWVKSDHTYYFWNGSKIKMLSGYTPGTLKRGRVDYWLLNEAQRFSWEAYKMIRPRLVDTSGLGVVAANPPRDEKGEWVMDLDEKVKAGQVRAIQLFELDGEKNPAIDTEALGVILDEFGEDDYRREIKGEMLPFKDRVLYAWSDMQGTGNVRPAPSDTTEITSRFSRQLFGRPFATVVGCDFQKLPHMAAAITRFWEDPDDPLGALSWWTHYIAIEGLEEELCEELAVWCHPDETALICDASGFFQDSERKVGASSVRRIKAMGFRWCFYPDRKRKANPNVADRMQAANARICPYPSKKRKAFSIPENRGLNRALKYYENNKTGQPNKNSRYSHLVDAATYVLWRACPRNVSRRRKRGYEAIEKKQTARERDLSRI